MNKLATLAKIANRLDSIGLTKEADVLDAFIRKVAEGQEYGQNYRDVPTRIANEISSGNPAISEQEFKKKFVDSFIDITAPASSNQSESLIEGIRRNAEIWADKMWNSPSSSRAAPWSDASTATGWEKYIVATGTIGNAVKQAWVRYTQSGAAGVDSSFKSFTSWYNNQLKNVWGGDHKPPTEIIKLLSERTTAQAMAGSHYDASSPSALVSGTPANKQTSTPASIGATRPDPFAEVNESAQRKIDQGFSNPAESLEYLRKK